MGREFVLLSPAEKEELIPLLSLGDADREALRKILTQTGFFPKKG
jgi:hypothetical protein